MRIDEPKTVAGYGVVIITAKKGRILFYPHNEVVTPGDKYWSFQSEFEKYVWILPKGGTIFVDSLRK